ncbi:NAD(P)/FAD-dependent oxidoreductase [Sediminimonas qiaohouensis]|uniref:NAD(P)/FAD-dependent oxidoreductase n=1 Tax=Sediminimonas qiaohouensis TaxID=552061 RepID=UPI001B7FAE76|nr:FAD-binding oxidoreductase [Sediminimonas qiaohouensis]
MDVVVIGSGFTGLSAALTLTRAGRSVAILEKDQLGAGASTRNGSQLGSGNQKFRVKTLIEMFGELKAKALLSEGVAMLDYIEELIRTENLDCHFYRCGRFRGAVRPAHYDAMARDMEDLHKFAGVESFMVPKQEQHKEIRTDYFYGGSVLPDDASLHPGLFHGRLVTRLREAGALLLDNTPALGIESDSKGFIVTTHAGPIWAANVIAATNGYTRGFDRYLSRRIVQVPSSVIVTEALPQKQIDAMMPAKRMYGNSARVFFYFRAAPSEPRLIWGGRAGRMVRADTPAAFGHLASDMLRVFPDLGEVKATHGWTGQIGYTFDDLPHLGKTPKGIHFAMGYCGTGVTRSIYFGHKVALKVLGSPKGRTEFDDITFPTHPFHFVADRAVPVFESWYRVKDAYS